MENINTCTPEEKLARFAERLDILTYTLKRDNPNISSLDVADFTTNILSVARLECHPDDTFEYISCGSFKECYDSGLPGYVIKFYSECNPIDLEMRLSQAAYEAGLDHIFLETINLELPQSTDAIKLDPCDDEPCDCDGWCLECGHGEVVYQQLTGFVLQPRVISLSQMPHKCITHTSEAAYLADPLHLAGGEVPYQTYVDMDSPDLLWAQAIIDTYGDETFNELHQFIVTHEIHDLHDGNIGYNIVNGTNYPIILDWLSDNP